MGHAADEAVKAALDMAQSVGAERGSNESSLLFGLGEYGDSVSISQYIEEAEDRAQSLFAQANSNDEGPLEDLDVLDVAAEFGRPDESTDEPDGTEVSVESRLALEETQNLVAGTVSRPEKSGREGLDHGKASRRPGRLSVGSVSVGVESGPSIFAASDEIEQLSHAVIEEKLAKIEEGSYFEILNVSIEASFVEIQRAFSAEMQMFEEERFHTEALAAFYEQGRLIRGILVEAFDVLTDPSLREQYGRALGNRT